MMKIYTKTGDKGQTSLYDSTTIDYFASRDPVRSAAPYQ